MKKKKKKKIFAFDLDGVVFDFNEAMLQYMNKYYGYKIQKRQIKSWSIYTDIQGMSENEFYKIFYEFEEAGGYLILKLINNAKRVINQLHELGYEICFVTARNIKWRNATQFALDMSGIKYDNIYYGKNKKYIFKTIKPFSFIDDKDENVLTAIPYVQHVFMLNHPYNRKFQNDKITKLRNWNDFKKVLVQMKIFKRGQLK